MAISLKDIYTYINGASAGYPWGSFKNASSGGSLDGTPFEQQWANDIYGFLQALLSKAGLVPSGAPDTAQVSQYLQALEALSWTPGDTKFVFRTTPGAGWLELNGGLIGDASSGGTERANADTEALFTALWSVGGLQLYLNPGSGGGPCGRGPSAAVDFGNHRRIAMPDMRGAVPRGWDHGRGLDAGRVLGSYQADAFAQHQHAVSYNSALDVHVGPTSGTTYVLNRDTDHDSTGLTGSGETRMKNVAGMWIIKY